MPSQKGHRFVVLDGLRGVAALVVLIFHLAQQHNRGALPLAAFAVDFFYMLSGFVVAFAYESRLQQGSMTWLSFAWVRIRRLYPLVFLGTGLGIALGLLAVMQHRISFENLALGGALGLLLLPSYVFPKWETAYPFNMASWSLTFELCVNAFYAAIAAKLTKRWLLGLVALGVMLLLWLVLRTGNISGGNNQSNFGYGFARVMFPFFGGVALYRFRSPQTKAPRLAVTLLLGLAALLLMPVQGAAISLLCIVVVFPAIIALGAATDVGVGLTWLCSLGGDMSYPIYMMQGPVLRVGEEVLKHLHGSVAIFWLFGAVEMVVVCAVAYAALRLFDQPIQGLLRQRVRPAKGSLENLR